MPVSLIDSHAHLDGPAYDEDRAEVLARAREAGVEEIIIIGAAGDMATARRAVALAESEAKLFATVGVHPHDAATMTDDWWPELEQLARRPIVVGIGETGLDYFYDHSPRQIQRLRFVEFIELARKLGKPLICHVRDAHDDAKAIIDEHRAGELGCVIHCFTGTPQDATDYVALGCHISFSGIVTFKGKKSEPLREAVRQVPLDRILIETDCPFLSPQPWRGKRNEPAYVTHTAEIVAREAGVELEALAKATVATTRSLFSLT